MGPSCAAPTVKNLEMASSSVGADAGRAQAVARRAVRDTGLRVERARCRDAGARRRVEAFGPQHGFQRDEAEQHVLTARGIAHGTDAPDLALELAEGRADLDAELLDQAAP